MACISESARKNIARMVAEDIETARAAGLLPEPSAEDQRVYDEAMQHVLLERAARKIKKAQKAGVWT